MGVCTILERDRSNVGLYLTGTHSRFFYDHERVDDISLGKVEPRLQGELFFFMLLAFNCSIS